MNGELADHGRVLECVLAFFRATDGVTGLLLSGTTATDAMDRWSDLDVGVVCASAAARERVWTHRWDWGVAPWLHRFDADHIKPHFVIYHFEPGIQTDLALYTPDDMPAPAGRPFRVAWDPSGELAAWVERVDALAPDEPDWSNVVHEEERFWAWLFYVWRHVARGEHYHVASELFALRDVLEQWHARLAGAARFIDRRVEEREGGSVRLARLGRAFPAPERAALRDACLALIELEAELRAEVDVLLAPRWRTSGEARERIAALVRAL